MTDIPESLQALINSAEETDTEAFAKMTLNAFKEFSPRTYEENLEGQHGLKDVMYRHMISGNGSIVTYMGRYLHHNHDYYKNASITGYYHGTELALPFLQQALRAGILQAGHTIRELGLLERDGIEHHAFN